MRSLAALAPLLTLPLVSFVLACNPEGSPRPPDSAATDVTAPKSGVTGTVPFEPFAPPTIETPLPGDRMGVTVHRLANGLTIYFAPNAATPRVQAWVVVRAGSRHDPATSTGLAHYLEHMLFKGTAKLGTLDFERERPHLERIETLYAELRQTNDPERRKAILRDIDRETIASASHSIPNELDRVYAKLGIEGVNAFTDDDATVYISELPKHRLEAWATLEADRFANPSFRLFYPELEAVYEEKNRTLDNPAWRAEEAFLRALYPQHPYGQQTGIGEVEHLKNPAYGDMLEYWERWYVPNNMAIVLAGDVDPKTALPLLERAFGEWKSRELPKTLPGTLSGPSGRVVTEVKAEVAEELTIGWRTVPFGHADEPALYVLDLLLDNAATGLLNVDLELPQRVVDAGASHESRREGGTFRVRATARDTQTLDEVESLLMAEIEKAKAGQFTDEDIAAIVLHDRIREDLELEGNEARVQRLAVADFLGLPWKDMLARDAAVRTVTKADVVRVAKQYLGSDRVVLRRVRGTPEIPKIEKPEITPVPLDLSRESVFAKDVLAIPATPIEPAFVVKGKDYVTGKLPAGPLVVARNPDNEVFDLRYEFDRGYETDPLLCLALELFERSGTANMDPASLQRRMYALGTTVGVSCLADRSTLVVSGVEANLEESLALLKTWIDGAVVDPEVLAATKASIFTTRREMLTEPDRLSAALSSYVRWGAESAWLKQPSNAAIRDATPAQLEALIRDFDDHTHRTYLFSAQPEAWPRQIELGKDHKRTKPPKIDRYRTAAPGAWIWVVDAEVAKTTASFAWPSAARKGAQQAEANLLGMALGGDMSSLLFQEIREARGLAYSVSGRVARGDDARDDWALVANLQTQVDKTVVAVRTLLDLVRAPLVEDRFKAAKASRSEIFRATRTAPREVTWEVAAFERRGEKKDPRQLEWKRLQGLDLAGLRAFAKSFTDGPVLIGVVANLDRLDLEGLKQLGTVEVVSAESLYSFGPFDDAGSSAPAEGAAPTEGATPSAAP